MRRLAGVVGWILAGVSIVWGQEVDSGRIYFQMAGTALGKKEYQSAVEYYKAGLEFRPGAAAAVYNVACAYSLMGNKKEALKWLDKAIDAGLYRFDDDTDLDNIRSTREYEKLRARGAKLLEEMKTRVFEPVVVLPEPFDSGRAYPVLLALHGYGSNPNDFSKSLKNVPGRTGFILCCPYGPDVLGKTSFGWGDQEDGEGRVLEDYEWMKDRFKIDTARVILLGFSQGGTFAYYLGLKHAARFEGVIPAAGTYDTLFNGLLPQAKPAKFFILLGGDESARRIDANLRAVQHLIEAGIAMTYSVYPGYGHVIPGDVDFEIKRAIEWVEKK